ncbi:SAM-dependent methyltransferase [Bacillus sp. FJAT-49711]|uniref:class I SAM-dependent methyltransferase n=1 Tax=Bacillus sp. FJAT-49711 TaxID=2833585 RepID=UPI001BC9FB94|nr:SAM-dependent methyltransferase [Bacillus sp. FJAT-49711]MBS4218089.1 SAM-dependent methyltransferase [Bacillus sp. FJAT-49711]
MEIKIVVGAGEYNNNPEWIHTQENELNLLDISIWKKRFDENTITAILAEQVWEHLTYEEGVQAAKICYKYLKTSGYIRCAVPDGFFPDETYQNVIKVGGPGPKDHPAASHKIVYNYKTLSDMFQNAGFEVKLLEYHDKEGNFHYNEWDGKQGVIFRSKHYDPRNKDGRLVFPSLIVDAIKI